MVLPSTGATGTFLGALTLTTLYLGLAVLVLAFFTVDIFLGGNTLVVGVADGGIVTVLSTTPLTALGRSAETRELVATTEAEGGRVGTFMSFGSFGFTSTTTGAAFGETTGK